MERILIVGNCLRYPVAAQLMQWLPVIKVISVSIPANESETLSLRQTLLDTDLLITMGLSDQQVKALAAQKAPTLKTLRIPTVGFAAFQPDICFVSNSESGETTQPVFNSAIGAWAFCQRLSIREAASLFNTRSFAGLGYLDAWAPSVNYLRESFFQSDLSDDFATFFYAVKRQGNGCFMHSFNHPTGFAIAALCRLICMRVGLDATDFEALPDSANPAAQIHWPVYPEIANALGLGNAGYRWQFYGQELNTLEHYLEWQFAQYCTEGLTPSTLKLINRDAALMNRVLSSRQ